MNNETILAELGAAGGIYRLLADGVTVRQLLDADVTLPQLLYADVTLRQLLDAGVTVRQLLDAGATLRQLLDAGATLRQLLDAGATLPQLLDAGATLPQLLDAGAFKNGIESEIAAIPIVPNIYSRMLSDIEAGRRKHDQSKFGPDSDPGPHLCGTPMCTAGHLVNLTGPIGYYLVKKYGWVTAGAMIHNRNRPEVPEPNFDGIKEEFAMAYIRARAGEENDAN